MNSIECIPDKPLDETFISLMQSSIGAFFSEMDETTRKNFADLMLEAFFPSRSTFHDYIEWMKGQIDDGFLKKVLTRYSRVFAEAEAADKTKVFKLMTDVVRRAESIQSPDDVLNTASNALPKPLDAKHEDDGNL